MTNSRNAKALSILSSARRHSEAAWKGAIDSATIDQDQHGQTGKAERAESDRDACLEAYDAALEALEAGNCDDAVEALETARTLEAEWGDSSDADRALEAVSELLAS